MGGENSDKNETEDSWAKLGDTISNFFGEKEESEEGAKEETKETKKDKKETKKKEEKPKKKKEFKPIVETIKEPLEFKLEILDAKDLTVEQLEISRQKLMELDARDQAKVEREQALNNLETAVIDTKDKLWQEIYEKSSTEEEREKILAKCTELSDWIDEEATFETPVEILEGKLKELTDLISGLQARVKQHTDRPEALEAMNRMINSSEHFLAKAKEAQPMHEMPKMTTSLIAEKALDMDREVKYMYNKVKIGKAAKDRKMEEEAKKKEKEEKKKAKKEAKKEAAENETEETNETKTDDESIKDEQTEQSETQENPETLETPEVSETPEAENPDVQDEIKENKEESLDDVFAE